LWCAHWTVPVQRAAWPFVSHLGFEIGETGDVAARPGEGFDEAGADRFGDLHEHDRHGTRGLQQRPRGCTANSQEDVGRECNQLRRVFANALRVGRAPADVNASIAADGPTEFGEPLRKRPDSGRCLRMVCSHAHQRTDPPHPLRLLRPRRKRPRRRRAAE